MACENAVQYMEISLHGFVVGDAHRIVAFDNTPNFLRRCDCFLLNDLKVLDNVQYDIRSHDRETWDLFVGEDLDVLMALCDKVLVLSQGKVSGIVDPKQVSKEDIGLLMTKGGRVDEVRN